jgi:hypothetical protein
VCHNWVPIFFEPKREEIAGDQITLVDEERYDLYCWPNIIWVIKWWACGICYVGEKRNACRVLVGKLKEIDHLLDLGVYGRII